MDMLANIRWATASGDILRDQFYESENLKRLFGAGSVTFRQFCPDSISADIKDFLAWLPRMGPEGKTYDAFDLRIRKFRLGDAPGAWAILSLKAGSQPGPDFDAIQARFGTGWIDCPPPPPNPHGRFVAATRPHGNHCIVYHLWKGSPPRTLMFQFQPDATLDFVRADAGIDKDNPMTLFCPQ